MPREAITVKYNSKIKETKRSRRSRAVIVPGVDNQQQTKLQGLN